jgi:hypothetical protein
MIIIVIRKKNVKFDLDLFEINLKLSTIHIISQKPFQKRIKMSNFEKGSISSNILHLPHCNLN